jgi:hypothetical protein
VIATHRQGSTARSAALIALAALAVHQLRYLLAYGSDSGRQLSEQGHAYLIQALPLLIGFAAATLAAGLVRAALRTRPGRPPIAAFDRRLALYAAAVASVFVVQETLEGAVFAGHASGLAAALGSGGWVALPLAGLFGAVCAALDGGFARLERLVYTVRGESARPRAPRRLGFAPTSITVPLASLPLAFGLARRPPPSFS